MASCSDELHTVQQVRRLMETSTRTVFVMTDSMLKVM